MAERQRLSEQAAEQDVHQTEAVELAAQDTAATRAQGQDAVQRILDDCPAPLPATLAEVFLAMQSDIAMLVDPSEHHRAWEAYAGDLSRVRELFQQAQHHLEAADRAVLLKQLTSLVGVLHRLGTTTPMEPTLARLRPLAAQAYKLAGGR